MSGKDLFEGMSYIDERFVEEAETQTIPRHTPVPWINIVSMAACLCLILAGAVALGSHVHPHPIESTPTETAGDQVDPETIIPSQPQLPPQAAEATEKSQIGEVPSVILRVDQMTDSGFIGTVAELVDTDIFEIGTELKVKFSDGTRNEAIMADAHEIKSQHVSYVGYMISVQFIDYDPETGTILVNLINQIEPGKDD